MLYLSIKKYNKIVTAVLVTLFFWLFTLVAYAADLSISPSTGSYSVGQTFTATISAVPNGDSVNAVESTLSFNTDVLSVVSVSKTGSAFSLWTTEPTFSNTNGTVQFGGGSPTPFTRTSSLIAVTFRTVAEGTGSISFTEASVLAADGRGTDVFKNSNTASLVVAAASTPDPTPTPTPVETESGSETEDGTEAIIYGDPPSAPEIGSQTFLDADIWYKETEGFFTWTLPFDVTAVALEISDDLDNRPEENEESIVDPPPEEYLITNDLIKDGEQYVSVNFKNQVGWGTPTNRKLLIDTTPPEPFVIAVRAGTSKTSFPLLTFEADDVTSGIQYYDMTIAGNEPIRVTPDEARLGYMLRELEDGTYTVKVVATDLAGNVRESSVAVLITAGWIKPVETEEEGSFWDFLTPMNLFVFFLLVVIILQIIYLWYEKKNLKGKEEKLRRETREIQDQMEKIFSALRDEIYAQVKDITKRKRLSAKEKEAVENLSQALEVSETLIEKEINDVKTILH